MRCVFAFAPFPFTIVGASQYKKTRKLSSISLCHPLVASTISLRARFQMVSLPSANSRCRLHEAACRQAHVTHVQYGTVVYFVQHPLLPVTIGRFDAPMACFRVLQKRRSFGTPCGKYCYLWKCQARRSNKIEKLLFVTALESGMHKATRG